MGPTYTNGYWYVSLKIQYCISNTHKVNDLTWGETEKMKVKNSHFDGKIQLT